MNAVQAGRYQAHVEFRLHLSPLQGSFIVWGLAKLERLLYPSVSWLTEETTENIGCNMEYSLVVQIAHRWNI